MKLHHHSSRRNFLGRAAGAGLLGGSLLEQAFFRAAQARAQAQTSPQPILFDIQKVGLNVYAAIARPQALLNANAVIFETANGLLIVDAHSKPSAAAALAAQIKREITNKPIRYIVNTHFHWDHTQGDPAYRRLAPHAEFVASTMTRDLLGRFGTIRASQSVEQALASLDGYHHQLETARTAAERTQLERTIAETNAYISEMRGYTPELPDITFDRSLILHDKMQELQLGFRGRGHTSGDIVVFSPENKVIATGDLLHGWFPFIADGYPREWPKTLTALSEFPFETIVGGHGLVQHGSKRRDQMAAYIGELTEAVESGKRKGQSVADLQASVSPATLRSLNEDYSQFLVSQSSNRTLNAKEILGAGVKGNVADIYARVDQQ